MVRKGRETKLRKGVILDKELVKTLVEFRSLFHFAHTQPASVVRKAVLGLLA